jgi:hypothetical protein
MNSNFRSVVFLRAYRIAKETKCEFKNRTVAELTSQIKGFDFYYQYSDDNRVYRYWGNIQNEISSQLKQLPNSFISAITGQLSNSNQIQSFI